MLLSLPGFAELQIVMEKKGTEKVQEVTLAFVKGKHKMHLVELDFAEPHTA